MLRFSTSAEGRSVGSEYRIRPARFWKRWASSAVIPRWCNCTCARVQASVIVRSNVAGSRYLSTSPTAASRDAATSVEKMRRTLSPDASRTRRRRLKIGSSTEPAVFDSGRPSITDMAVRMPRPRPRNRPRSVSYWAPPPAWPSTTTMWAAQTDGSAADRTRRVASRAPRSATDSVWTKRLEKAGCAASAAGGANASSA